MLLDDTATRTLAPRTRTANHAAGRAGAGGPLTGTPIYHCYGYDRSVHGRPADAEGTILLGLPTAARDWRRDPWRQYETLIVLEADHATAWLGDRLNAAAQALVAADPYAVPRLAARRWACNRALFSLESACHASVAFPNGNVLAWAIVAVWDRTRTHPLLDAGTDRFGTAADSDGEARAWQ